MRQNAFPLANNRLLRLLPLLVIVGLLLGACDKVKEVVPDAIKPEPKLAAANFHLGTVTAVDPQNRSDSAQKANEEAAKVLALMNAFYSAAFLDPAKWEGGQHPDLAPLFTAEAQPGVAANLTSLAMSDLSDKIESVESGVQNVDRLTMFVDEDGSLPVGLASVSFEAVAQPEDGGDEVTIRHAASYWLQRDGDGYRISAFTADLKAGAE